MYLSVSNGVNTNIKLQSANKDFSLKSTVCVILHISTYILSWKEGKEIGKKMKIPEGMLPKHKQPLPPSVVA